MSRQTSAAASVERIYVLDGGTLEIADASMYSPGIDVGKPISLPCNAYLIRRAGTWILWDSGIADKVIDIPGGEIIEDGIRSVLKRTLISQLDEIGVNPVDVSTLMLSHAHLDHVGNTGLFPSAKWIVHRKEYQAMFGPDNEGLGYYDPALSRTLRDNPTKIVDGDHDVFGDGSIRLIATPGHTPGHCSLAVQLPKSGTVILSGDVAHFHQNFIHRRVPSFNFDAKQTKDSMETIDRMMKAEKAQLWINHDAEQCATIPRAPQWVE